MSATVRRSRASISSSTSSTRQPRRLARACATVVLPAAMKPTRKTLSTVTVREPIERIEEAGVRDVHRGRAGYRGRPGGAGRGDRERHREAVVVARVHRGAAQVARAQLEAVGELVDLR